MNKDLAAAKEQLLTENLTCVLQKDTATYTSRQRGVAPLLAFLESNTNFVGFSAADRVVGNGAAFLYVLLGVKEIYGEVMSEPAKATLEAFGINACFGLLVPGIRNRQNSGPCPIEAAVRGITSPQEALLRIKLKLQELKS